MTLTGRGRFLYRVLLTRHDSVTGFTPSCVKTLQVILLFFWQTKYHQMLAPILFLNSTLNYTLQRAWTDMLGFTWTLFQHVTTRLDFGFHSFSNTSGHSTRNWHHVLVPPHNELLLQMNHLLLRVTRSDLAAMSSDRVRLRRSFWKRTSWKLTADISYLLEKPYW